jgi:predicted PurR-regulated permease PerM
LRRIKLLRKNPLPANNLPDSAVYAVQVGAALRSLPHTRAGQAPGAIMQPEEQSLMPQRIVRAICIALAVGLCALVLRPFLTPILWAAILAYVTWPLHVRLKARLGGRTAASALLMTMLVGAALLVPLLLLGAVLRDEVSGVLAMAREYLSARPLRIPEALRQLWGARRLDDWLASHVVDARALDDEIAAWTRLRSRELLAIAGGIGRDLLQFVFCLVTLFFLYREADAVVAQVRSVSRRMLGDGVDRYWRTIRDMVRAVVYGVLMTALAQGVVAGVGFAIAGVQPCALLGTLTMPAAFIPVVGTLAVIGPAAASLLMAGRIWAGIFLLLWGLLLVHPIDNVVRPLVVSSVTRTPFLLAMFGVPGGLLAFGLAGLFAGPVVLAVGLALWKEMLVPVPVLTGAGAERCRTTD